MRRSRVQISPVAPACNKINSDFIPKTATSKRVGDLYPSNMTTDRVFVLMMMVLLMMAGCFEATSTTEAEEEQDSTSGNDGTSDNVPNDDVDDDTSSNDPVDSPNGQGSDSSNSGTSTSNSQERIWYSSGGVVNSKWTDGDIEHNGYEKCFEYGPLYDSSTGEYIGEECKRFGVPQFESDWNTTNCTNIGGTPSWNSDNYRYAPQCIDIPLVTIFTNPGEVLMIYQEESVNWDTTCGGVSFSVYKPSNVEYEIVEGSSMSCTHELTYNMNYDGDMSSNVPYIWSIVYEIQDSIVV